jgi:hypothetical protein
MSEAVTGSARKPARTGPAPSIHLQTKSKVEKPAQRDLLLSWVVDLPGLGWSLKIKCTQLVLGRVATVDHSPALKRPDYDQSPLHGSGSALIFKDHEKAGLGSVAARLKTENC